MNTVFLIFDNNQNCKGYVATFEEAVKIVSAGEGKYNYNEIKDININGAEQTCYEILFNC